MSELPKALAFPVWGVAGRTLYFERTEDVVRWAEDEVKRWNFERKPQSQPLLQALDTQRNSFSAIANYARQLEPLLQIPHPVATNVQQQIAGLLNNLNSALTAVTQGSILTTEHPNFRFVSGLAEKDIDAAATLLIASRSTAGPAFVNMSAQVPLPAIARMAVGIAEMDDDSGDITAYRGKLASINNDAEKTLASIRTTLDEEVTRSQEIAQEHSSRVEKHSGEWGALLEKCETEWSGLKAVYDEKLSLLAPTEYWKTQADQYKTQGIWYAVAFGLVLVALLVLFAILGIDELKAMNAAKPASVVLAILPIIIPAFAGIWVLRILGRQLAESLTIMKDATERVTLVKTFLALMRDETAGKAVVKDEDRALILTALFRQSRVTAADDSPPLNALDSLLKYARHSG